MDGNSQHKFLKLLLNHKDDGMIRDKRDKTSISVIKIYVKYIYYPQCGYSCPYVCITILDFSTE